MGSLIRHGQRFNSPALPLPPVDQPVWLLPFVRVDMLSIQDAAQQAGWSITAFDLPTTWKKTEGEGVIIAVLDTGCDLTHEDIKENLLTGYNMIDPSLPPTDDNGHGTHVTGIIVAVNNQIGMVGVAPKAKVIPIKVLDRSGNGTMSNVAAGIRRAIEVGADIISMSLGTPMPIPEVEAAIAEADAKGIPVFCAAGNAGNTNEVYFPAAYRTAISIGAIDENFNRATFSNSGKNLDFMCPGVEILSTVPTNWYAKMSGTSMAQPFACGIAALLKAACIKYHTDDCTIMGADAYREKFRLHTRPLADKSNKFYGGFGIIDVTTFTDFSL